MKPNSSPSPRLSPKIAIVVLAILALAVAWGVRTFLFTDAFDPTLTKPGSAVVDQGLAADSPTNRDLPASGAAGGQRVEPAAGVASAPLDGAVLDEQGRPIGDAEVVAGPRSSLTPGESTAMVRSFDPERSRTARTATDGTFRILGLVAGTIDVVARAPGRVPAAVVNLAIDARKIPPLVLRLSPARVLEGTVASATGQPIADATIVVDVMDWRPDDAARPEVMTRRAQSDEEGRFRVEGLLPNRPLRALATARGYLEGQGVNVAANVGTVAIQLDASPMVLLQIIDLASGAVLPAAEVEFAPDGAVPGPFSPLLLRGVAADQRLHRAVPAGTVLATDLAVRSTAFLVRAVDHAVARIEVEGLEPGEVRNRLVELEPEAMLVGRVTRADGASVGAATIRADDLGAAAATDATEALVAGDFARADPLSGFGPRTRPPFLLTTSDADGRFELRGLGSGSYRVRVEVEQRTDLVEPIEVVVKNGPNEMPPIVLQERATLVCAVLDAGGRRLAAATVTITAYFDSGDGVNFLETLAEPLATGRTDAAGNVTVNWLAPGRVVVRARVGDVADATRDGRSEVELRAGQTEHVTVRMPGG